MPNHDEEENEQEQFAGSNPGNQGNQQPQQQQEGGRRRRRKGRKSSKKTAKKSRKSSKKSRSTKKTRKTRKGKRKTNAFFTLMMKAKKSNAPSFKYNGKTYNKKQKGHLVYYKP